MHHASLDSTNPLYYLAPDHLQAMAYLYGISTPNLEHAKFLELGCGQGEYLAPIAYSYPHSESIGIDIFAEQIETGQAQLVAHGLNNAQLYCVDIETLINTKKLGKFDYIVIRGLFAQTDLNTRTELLKFCQKNLSENGIIVIDYEVYPGSKSIDSIYDAMVFHAAQTTNVDEQIDSLDAMQAFLKSGLDTSQHTKNIWELTLQSLEKKNKEKLYLETLNELRNPCYFIEFSNQSAEANLCYVGDAQAHTELPEHWGNKIALLLKAINPTNNKILDQQYLDFLCNRTTRMSILTHASQQPFIASLPNLKRLADLRWSGYFERIEPDFNSYTNKFETKNKEIIDVSNKTTANILHSIGLVYPFSLDINHIIINTRSGLDILNNNSSIFNDYESSLENIFTRLGHKLRLSCVETAFDRAQNTQLSLWAYPYNTTHSPSHLQDHQEYLNLHYEVIQDLDLSFYTKKTTELCTEASFDQEAYQEHLVTVNTLKKWGLVHSSTNAWKEFYNTIIYSLASTPIHVEQLIIKSLLFNFPHLINSHFHNTPTLLDIEAEQQEKDLLNNEVYQFIREQSHEELKKYIENNSEIQHLHTIWYELALKQYQIAPLDAYHSILHSIALKPKNMEQYALYAQLCISLYKNLNQVPLLLQRILELNTENVIAWVTLADYESYFQHNYETELILNHAFSLSPEDAIIEIKLANNYSVQGKHKQAISIYEKHLKQNLSNIAFASTYSNYLFSLIHTDIYSPEKLFEIHKGYGELVNAWAKMQNWQPDFSHKKNYNDNRPLRIGFVSGDLRAHPVSKFLLPYWEGLDKDRFHIYAYANHPVHDDTSNRLQASAKKWKKVFEYSNLELAKTIYEDNIDVLIDLSGHTGYNRLPVFALKPAPVQMTWIGYPATTGLKKMDYKITSAAYANLSWMQEQFTEKLLYVNNRPPFDSIVNLPPLINKMPCEKKGYFTFASFNRPQKITKKVLKTWAEILKQCPDDKLLIANMPDNESIQEFKDQLVNFGIKEDQLVFRKRVGLNEYMEMHNEVDLLLDTFPYNGGTTALHAISMGVATIVLAGKSMVNHPHIYYTFGLQDFLASNTEEYKNKALYWKNKKDELPILKKDLHRNFEKINLNSETVKKTNAEIFSNLLNYVWDNYLEHNAPKSNIIDIK